MMDYQAGNADEDLDRHLRDGELGYWRECYRDQLARANVAVKALREITRLPCQYPDDPDADRKMALDSVKAQEIARAALAGGEA